ncbi:MAG: iron-sulfur cluster assembly scaffold protein [Christensenella sp.]|nr:iron-sulfur cluster assembly scaffold protein [Christensenella sp.]
MYNEQVMKEFQNLQNVGYIEDHNAYSKIGNAACGDIMEMTMYINPETDIIERVAFRTFGCAAAQATSSRATTLVKGKTVQEALELSNKAVVESLGGLPAQKMHCSVLAEEAIKACVEDYLSKKNK